MRTLILLLGGAGWAAAQAGFFANQCGGLVMDARTRQPLPNAAVKLVPAAENQPVVNFASGEDGRWLCEPRLAAGLYLVRAVAIGYGVSEASYWVTVDAAGAVTERVGMDVNKLDFVLAAAGSEGRPSRVGAPEPGAPVELRNDDARVLPTSRPGERTRPNPPKPGPSAAKAPPAKEAPPQSNCDECPQLVDVVINVSTAKEDRTPWDLGAAEPELVAVLAPVAADGCERSDVRLPRTTDLDTFVDIANFPGAKRSFRGCNAQKMSLGGAGAKSLHCYRSHSVAFKAVPLPLRPFRVFLADIDILYHDLVFEHAPGKYRHQCGDFPCENQEHVGAAEACDYGRPGTGLFAQCDLVTKTGYKVGTVTVVPSLEAPLGPNQPPTAVASKILSSLRTRSTTEIPAGFWEERADALLTEDQAAAQAATVWARIFNKLYDAFETEVASGQLRCRIEDLYRVANEYLMRTGPTGLGMLDNLSFVDKLTRAKLDQMIKDGATLEIVGDELAEVAAWQWEKTASKWIEELKANPGSPRLKAHQQAILEDFQRRGLSLTKLQEISLRADADEVYKELLAQGSNHDQALRAMTNDETYRLLADDVRRKNLARIQAQIKRANWLKNGAKALRIGLKALDFVELVERLDSGPGAQTSVYQTGREQFMLRLAARVESLVLKSGYRASPHWQGILKQRFREINDAFTPLTPPPLVDVP